MVDKRVVIIVITLIVIFLGGYVFLSNSGPNDQDYNKCPICSSNASYITFDDTYFYYYCQDCGCVFGVTKAVPHLSTCIENDSELYNVILNIFQSEKKLDELYQQYKNKRNLK